jgi:beta-aspartyl-dipeptidase (metallo-type)
MKAMMIKHAELYTPEHVGIRDMLIANDRIVAIGTDLEFSMGAIETIDLQGRIAIPVDRPARAQHRRRR